MTLLLKNSKTINWIIFSYLLVIIGLSLSDTISFGHGLGDITYIFTLIVSTTIHLILIRAINRIESVSKKETYYLFVAAVFLLISLCITYKFTIGRGAENAWDSAITYNVSGKTNTVYKS
ncbi:MAG: hypothetical protein JKY42_04985 [Flavobacteriales bacterium]|nr:hypothetical protein [Flavobacteriales bacterium]